MPDQDRKPSFLSQELRDGVRCPICPGLIGATFQADCLCCGRQVAACSTQSDSKAEDLTTSVKALSIKTEVVPQVCSSSQYVTQSVAQDSQPVQAVSPASPRTSNVLQRHCNIPIVRSYSSLDQRPGGGTRDGVGSTQGPQLAGGGSRSAAIRIHQQPQYVVRPLPSRKGPTRGRSGRGAGRGTYRGAHHDFKGVRTRKGVKGFLVEIRPPKWKRTIWLGTYNTSVEAAGAYDAGVFYTKKSSTKYNFHSSEGAFPPLPAHLRLDRDDSMDELKLFVQKQARAAASRVVNAAMGSTTTTPRAAHHREVLVPVETPVAASNSTDANSLHEPTSSESCITGDSSIVTVNADDFLSTTCMNSSAEQLVEIASEFHIPMDLDYLGQCLHAETAEETAKNMFLDYTNYLSQQGAPDQQLLPDEEEEDQFITS